MVLVVLGMVLEQVAGTGAKKPPPGKPKQPQEHRKQNKTRNTV